MMSIPLRLGPLGPPGFPVRRSSVRWLVEDGQQCRAGQLIGFCNIGIIDPGRRHRASQPFAAEAADLQVAFAASCSGTVRHAHDAVRGGYMSLMPAFQSWHPDTVIGHIETNENGAVPDQMRLLLTAGRRPGDILGDRSGLLTGSHDRSRAWWGDGEFTTLLSLGICEQLGVIRGDQFVFRDLFDAVPGPAHVVYTPDDVLVPFSLVVSEQISRTPAQAEAIVSDMNRALLAGAVSPTPGDLIFAGYFQAAIARSPLTEEYEMLSRDSLTRAGPPKAVVLSLSAEPAIHLRHRRLGYAVQVHLFRVQSAGPAIHEWLRTEFEPVKRSYDQILHDYRDMIDLVRSRQDTTFLIMNAMSTSGHEDIYTYAPFDPPMGDILSGIRAKEMNLLLHDLARDRDVAIVDVDAIAAELGAAMHLPDGVHQSGLMQTEIRSEILRILRDRQVRGFNAALVR